MSLPTQLLDAIVPPLASFYKYWSWEKTFALLFDIGIPALAIFVLPPASTGAVIFYSILTPFVIAGNFKAFNLFCFGGKPIGEYDDLGVTTPQRSPNALQSTAKTGQLASFSLGKAATTPPPRKVQTPSQSQARPIPKANNSLPTFANEHGEHKQYSPL